MALDNSLIFNLTSFDNQHLQQHISVMAAMVGKYAANKLLKKQMSKYTDKNVTDGDVRQDLNGRLTSTFTDKTLRIHSSPWSKIANAQAK